MKTIKSVLIGALVALLGSSAWAAVTVDCGTIDVSQNSTNDLKEVYLASDINISDSRIADSDIANIVTVDGQYVGITGNIADGETKVILSGMNNRTGTNYLFHVISTTVTIEKDVMPAAGDEGRSNATIRIKSHILKAKKKTPPNILFIGTLCAAHSLKKETVKNSLDGLASVGNVDYFLYKNDTLTNGPGTHYEKNHLDQGDPIAESDFEDLNDSSAHYSLSAFYSQLNNVKDKLSLTEIGGYDYIVFEFDGSRLAGDDGNGHSYSAPTYESDIAKLLKPYYDANRVIWVLDNGVDYAEYYDRVKPVDHDKGDNIFEYGGQKKYRPINYWLRKRSNANQYAVLLSNDDWKGLIGLLDPELYLDSEKSDPRYRDMQGDRLLYTSGTSTTTTTRTPVYAAKVNENQLWYDKSDTIGKSLAAMIKPLKYDMELTDTVVKLDDSLIIRGGVTDGIKYYVWGGDVSKEPSADDGTGKGKWELVTPFPGLMDGDNKITASQENISNECWTLLTADIQITDATKLITKALAEDPPAAVWDEESKSFKFNPNKGEAAISVKRKTEDGSVVTCSQAAQATMNAWELPAQPIIITATDYFDVYDGNEHGISFTVNPAVNPYTSEKTQVRFKTDNSTWTDWTNYTDRAEIWPTWTDCCWSNKVYIEARCVPGYADTNALAYVTITQRVVRIQANDATKTYDGEPLTNNTFTVLSGFVDGEGFADNKTTMSASSKQTDFGTHDNEITKVGGSYQLNYRPNTKASNYTIETEKGTLTVNKRPIQATVQSAEKFYDGNPTGIVVTVSNVIDADKAKITKTYTPTGNSFVNVSGNEIATTVSCTVEVNDNYTPIMVGGTVKIKRRPVTLSTSSVNVIKPYDQVADFPASAIVDATAGQTDKGYVTGEKFTYSNLAKNSTPGTTIDATFDYAANATILANNYTVSRTYGKLTVQAAPAPHNGCKDPVEPVYVPPAAVYDWRFTGKTGVGVLVRKNWTTGGGCVDTASGSNVEVIRVPGSMAIQAYTYICDDECMLFGSQLTLPTKFEYYATKPFKGMAYRLVGNDPTDGVQPGTHIKVAHVIGKSHNQYELGGVARFAFGGTGYAQDPQQVFELTFAGFGSYSAKNGRISSVSGRYAGSLQPPRYNSVVNGVGCPAADYWDCQTLNYAGAAGTRTVAYGTWSVKYNSAASKRLESNSKYWVK